MHVLCVSKTDVALYVTLLVPHGGKLKAFIREVKVAKGKDNKQTQKGETGDMKTRLMKEVN